MAIHPIQLGVCIGVLVGATCGSFAQTTVQIVADNDFAILTGTETGVTRLLYQNNVSWGEQIGAAESFTFSLLTGETTFYVLAMGGGGQENISGMINGVNLVTVHDNNPTEGLMSSPIEGFLTSYDLGSVSGGAYDVILEDVQAALGSVTW